MRKVIIFLLAAVFSQAVTLAQSRPDLNAALIPQELKTNASAVIRNEEFTTEVVDIDHVVYKKKTAITILNSSGEDYAAIVVFYDKSIVVKSVKGNLFDKNGILIAKIPESKFRDYSAYTGSLFTDNRVKAFNPAYSNYPFTIEYEYEVKYKNSFYFLNWHPQPAGEIGVEKSTYRFICDQTYPARIKEYNIKGEKVEFTEGKNRIYRWTIENLRPFKNESYVPREEDFLPIVKVAPVKFQYEGLKGSFSTWEEYGKWTYDFILRGRDALPPETIAKIQTLVKDLDSPKDKARKIYEYVQNKTRYVSIQKGIGGIQPMKAADVDRLSYGDCKALSYYTQALLKVVGIESHYAEVLSGSRIKDITLDFPSVQGDHVILCVPIQKDTVWLECTSQTIPFGYLGTFTDNRNVILCTEKGGVIAKTKSFKTEENTQIRKAFFKLDDEGNLEGKMATFFNGFQYDNRNHLITLAGKERTDEILDLYPINNLQIKKYDIKQDKSEQPVTVEDFEFTAASFSSKSNNRLFLYLNPVNRFNNFLKDQGTRKNPIWISRGYIDEDNIEYLLPENFEIESMPKDVEIKNEFGEFTAKITVEGNKLVYRRKLLLNNGTFPAESYNKLREYYLKISYADQQKLVLIKS